MMRMLFLLAALLLFPGAACAALTYTGAQTLWQDTIWEGEVIVDGVLTVAPMVTLEIRPGTVVRFTSYDSNADGIGEHEIFIQGRLRAEGTAEAPIRFTAAEKNPSPGSWGAINMMMAEEENRLSHCIVEYGYRGFHAHFAAARVTDSIFRHNMRGFQFQESTVTVERCRVEENVNGMQFRNSTVLLRDCTVSGSYWGVRCVYVDLTVEGCRIMQNLINGLNARDSQVLVRDSRIAGNRRGLYLQRSQGTVRGNMIVENSEYGIFLEDSEAGVVGNRISENGRAGVRWLDSSGEFSGNDLAGNGIYALVNDGSNSLAAPGNWWGSNDPAVIEDRVRDGSDRPGLGLVDSRNPLSGPPDLTPPAARP